MLISLALIPQKIGPSSFNPTFQGAEIAHMAMMTDDGPKMISVPRCGTIVHPESPALNGTTRITVSSDGIRATLNRFEFRDNAKLCHTCVTGIESHVKTLQYKRKIMTDSNITDAAFNKGYVKGLEYSLDKFMSAVEGPYKKASRITDLEKECVKHLREYINAMRSLKLHHFTSDCISRYSTVDTVDSDATLDLIQKIENQE